MSYWTHICATLYVDTHIEDKKIKSKITDFVRKAPKFIYGDISTLSPYNT